MFVATSTTKRRTQPPEVRREQLLDAAAALLVEKGFASMTVAEVAERAGVAKGTVYLYFDTKESLVAGLQAKYDEALVEQVRVLNQGGGSELARLESFLRATLDFHVAERQLHEVLFHQAGMRDDETLRTLAGELERYISAGVETGAFHVDDARFTAEFMLHGLHGALVAHLHDRRTGRTRFIASCSAVCRQLLGVE